MATGTASQPAAQRSRLLGGLLLWFAVLGGAGAWGLHLLAAWGTDELACASGHRDVAGVPLTTVLILAVVVPGAVALAALGAAWLAWRRTSRDGRDNGDAGTGRAHLMALVGLGANLLFVAIIAFGGAAVLVLPPC
jgi:hypothetical protein